MTASKARAKAIQIYTTGMAAKACGMNRRTIARLADNGEIGSFRTATGHRRIPRQSLIDFMELEGILLDSLDTLEPSKRGRTVFGAYTKAEREAHARRCKQREKRKVEVKTVFSAPAPVPVTPPPPPPTMLAPAPEPPARPKPVIYFKPSVVEVGKTYLLDSGEEVTVSKAFAFGGLSVVQLKTEPHERPRQMQMSHFMSRIISEVKPSGPQEAQTATGEHGLTP